MIEDATTKRDGWEKRDPGDDTRERESANCRIVIVGCSGYLWVEIKIKGNNHQCQALRRAGGWRVRWILFFVFLLVHVDKDSRSRHIFFRLDAILMLSSF